jgi:hypothetical protein
MVVVLEVLVLEVKVLLVVMAHPLNRVAVVALEPLVLPQYHLQAMALAALEQHHQFLAHLLLMLVVAAVQALLEALAALGAEALVGLQQELMEPSILVVVEAVVQQLQAQAAPVSSSSKSPTHTLPHSLAA